MPCPVRRSGTFARTWPRGPCDGSPRAPSAAAGILGFLAARAVPGVESAENGSFGRTLRLAHGPATIWLTPQDGHVRCDLRLADVRDLGSAVARTRRLLDLDADPEGIE